MSMEDVILYCFKSGETMRYTTLYHLLKGKKTSSILVFGKFYGLLDFFNLFPKLSQQDFTRIIYQLVDKGYLTVVDDNKVQISKEGEAEVQWESFRLVNLKQRKYDRVDQLFFQRLSFATQIVSNKVHEFTQYEPIDNDAFHQMRMKVWLDHHKEADLPIIFFEEWKQVITSLNKTEQSILVEQLSGFNEVGLTINQISNLLDYSPIAGYLIYKTALHKVLDDLNQNKEAFPIFFSLFGSILEELPPGSIDVTRRLFFNGASPQEIANQRRLKLSTISDHLIELFITSSITELRNVIPKDILLNISAYKQTVNSDFKNWKYSDVVRSVKGLEFYVFRWCQFYFVEQEVIG